MPATPEVLSRTTRSACGRAARTAGGSRGITEYAQDELDTVDGGPAGLLSARGYADRQRPGQARQPLWNLVDTAGRLPSDWDLR